MENHIQDVLSHMLAGLGRLWPYLLLSIPLAAAIKVFGLSKHVNRIIGARPITSILLATLIGAFSPFCSCTSVAVMASLLIGGVPLAPVMSLWVASPSMDPEMFFLTVGMIGWELAIWRLMATLGMSIAAGLVTHFLVKSNWIEESSVLKIDIGHRLLGRSTTPVVSDDANSACAQPTESVNSPSLAKRILRSSLDATWLVGKFMAIALLLEALITLYVPTEWIVGILGRQSVWAVPIATAVGLPMYTSNLTALPLMAGLLDRGMAAPAVLAFLVAGPTTTLPAMACVWGIVTRKVFMLYLMIVLVCSVAAGYIYMLFQA